jgi:hypothetical protein
MMETIVRLYVVDAVDIVRSNCIKLKKIKQHAKPEVA